MAKENFTYEDFMLDVPPENTRFVNDMHKLFTEKGCTVKITSAKSGFVVSYSLNKRVLFNYIFRKSGMIARIYGDFAHGYIEGLDLPSSMLKAVEKAPLCRRLHDPSKCLQTCRMGYIFNLNGKEYKNCQYSAFMFPINDESKPFIRSFIENEICSRESA